MEEPICFVYPSTGCSHRDHKHHIVTSFASASMLAVRAVKLRQVATSNLRSFSTSSALSEKPLPPRRVIPETEFTESFLKGTGPGGQKINKTSSAVQLKHLPTGIVVKCQDTRSREQNRKTARKLLGEKLEELELGDQARTVVKRERMAVKKRSGEKKRRRKYRALEAEKEGTGEELQGDGGVGEGGDDAVKDGARTDGAVQSDAADEKIKMPP